VTLPSGDPITIEIHVHHHFDSVPIPIVVSQDRRAVRARLFVAEEQSAMTTINVDTTNETATVGFEDSHGDQDAAQPDGSSVVFSSDNEAVLTVAATADNPLVGAITVVGEGDANISASVNGADGNPLTVAADGTTPFAQAGAVAVHVDPGQAVGDRITVAGG
jgi:hypothetical protein